jgi:hypothetical protein
MSSNTEELRESILKAGRERFISGSFIQEHYDNDTVSPIEHEVMEIIEIGVDDLMKIIEEHDSTLKAEYEEKVREADIIENQLIDERDKAEYWADTLAEDIALMADMDVGEHSNINDPWSNAHNIFKDNFESIASLAQPPKEGRQ